MYYIPVCSGYYVIHHFVKTRCDKGIPSIVQTLFQSVSRTTSLRMPKSKRDKKISLTRVDKKPGRAILYLLISCTLTSQAWRRKRNWWRR